MVIMNTGKCIGNSWSSGKYKCKIFLRFIGCDVSLSFFAYLNPNYIFVKKFIFKKFLKDIILIKYLNNLNF
jgi:hypothetical protein